MPDTATKSVTEILNKQLANWNVLYIKLLNFHWYVKGPNFFVLHEKFEEFYNEAQTRIDAIAERILSLKGAPFASMREFLENSDVDEANGNETTKEMVEKLCDDFELIVDELRVGIDAADEQSDHSTADMLTEIQESLQMHTWMLRSFLDK